VVGLAEGLEKIEERAALPGVQVDLVLFYKDRFPHRFMLNRPFEKHFHERFAELQIPQLQSGCHFCLRAEVSFRPLTTEKRKGDILWRCRPLLSDLPGIRFGFRITMSFGAEPFRSPRILLAAPALFRYHNVVRASSVPLTSPVAESLRSPSSTLSCWRISPPLFLILLGTYSFADTRKNFVAWK
jgi:hypothetical protein